MKTLNVIIVCAAAFMPITIPALAQDNTAATAATVDAATFVNMATSSNMLEIQSSEMALQRASSEDVKSFANQMIQDHTKASQEMAAVLQKKGMAAPAELEPNHKQMLQELADNTANFDAAYVQLQRAAHEEAVGLFTSYSNNPDDQELGAFAQKTLPTLQMHLDHVTKLNNGN